MKVAMLGSEYSEFALGDDLGAGHWDGYNWVDAQGSVWQGDGEALIGDASGNPVLVSLAPGAKTSTGADPWTIVADLLSKGFTVTDDILKMRGVKNARDRQIVIAANKGGFFSSANMPWIIIAGVAVVAGLIMFGTRR
jgi:hypothetical protein